MPKKLNKIIKDLFIKHKIDKLQETEQEINNILGQGFLKKHTKEMFFQNEKIIIKTKTIEAKTELNIIKKKLQHKNKIIIK